MPLNIEIKAKLADVVDCTKRVEELGASFVAEITQEDVFFNCTNGRLKLRFESNQPGHLIFYTRNDELGPKPSEYNISYVNDAEPLKVCLSKAYGVRGSIKKRRKLYMLGQTRIHLDEVEGLGTFLELEVVLNESQTLEFGEATAKDIMHRLNVPAANLISEAYIDMITKSNTIDC